MSCPKKPYEKPEVIWLRLDPCEVVITRLDPGNARLGIRESFRASSRGKRRSEAKSTS